MLHHAFDGFQLVLHHVAEHFVLGEIVGDERRRGVGAVSRAEGVVDVAVGVGGQPLHELLLRSLHGLLGFGLLRVVGVVGQAAGLALLLGVETQVLQKHHFAGLQIAGHAGGFVARAVAGEEHLASEQPLDVGDDLTEGVFGIGILLRTAQMRHQDHRAAAGEYFFDGGDRRADAGVVRYAALVVEGTLKSTRMIARLPLKS